MDSIKVLQSLISPWKRKGKKKVITTRGIHIWSPIQILTLLNRTLLSRWNMLLSLWYSDSMLNTFFEISKMRKSIKKRKKSLILHGWELLVIALVSWTKITRSHGLVTLLMWKFSTVLHLLLMPASWLILVASANFFTEKLTLLTLIRRWSISLDALLFCWPLDLWISTLTMTSYSTCNQLWEWHQPLTWILITTHQQIPKDWPSNRPSKKIMLEVLLTLQVN